MLEIFWTSRSFAKSWFLKLEVVEIPGTCSLFNNADDELEWVKRLDKNDSC